MTDVSQELKQRKKQEDSKKETKETKEVPKTTKTKTKSKTESKKSKINFQFEIKTLKRLIPQFIIDLLKTLLIMIISFYLKLKQINPILTKILSFFESICSLILGLTLPIIFIIDDFVYDKFFSTLKDIYGNLKKKFPESEFGFVYSIPKNLKADQKEETLSQLTNQIFENCSDYVTKYHPKIKKNAPKDEDHQKVFEPTEKFQDNLKLAKEKMLFDLRVLMSEHFGKISKIEKEDIPKVEVQQLIKVVDNDLDNNHTAVVDNLGSSIEEIYYSFEEEDAKEQQQLAFPLKRKSHPAWVFIRDIYTLLKSLLYFPIFYIENSKKPATNIPKKIIASLKRILNKVFSIILLEFMKAKPSKSYSKLLGQGFLFYKNLNANILKQISKSNEEMKKNLEQVEKSVQTKINSALKSNKKEELTDALQQLLEMQMIVNSYSKAIFDFLVRTDNTMNSVTNFLFHQLKCKDHQEITQAFKDTQFQIVRNFASESFHLIYCSQLSVFVALDKFSTQILKSENVKEKDLEKVFNLKEIITRTDETTKGNLDLNDNNNDNDESNKSDDNDESDSDDN
ncbi:nnp-1 protein putative nuclear protein 1 nop52 [Anaeramoeba ignava]|uniref:Nnp-1 protein putative nuclear protein 1 nop52 n=1 Tax=Anaeramoeba ignava TaxID=1746090 RepID=A0A9Q0L732_ANAIG|nr:nnp-1 protein putative nuclear protein 1 nop52 [Anaeramoeba ignava]